MAALERAELQAKRVGGDNMLDRAVVPASGSTAAAAATEVAPKKKICCACPETKRQRDNCVAENGPDACSKWIDAHLQCLRAEGFKV